MLTEAQTRDCLVPLGAVTAVEGLTSVTGAASPAWPFGWTSVVHSADWRATDHRCPWR